MTESPKPRRKIGLWEIVPAVAAILIAVVIVNAAIRCSRAIPVYEVILETGLYPALAESEPMELLPEGTLLVPAWGQRKLDCGVLQIEGHDIEMCKVEVQGGGPLGWVIKDRIRRK